MSTFPLFTYPVIYEAKSYIIRKNEPLDFILLVTLGVIWIFGSSTSTIERLEGGSFHGHELLEWKLSGTSYAQFSFSEANLKCHNKVEAFALMAKDLENVLEICWSEFSRQSQAKLEGVKPFAAASLKGAFQRFIHKKKLKNSQLSIVTI